MFKKYKKAFIVLAILAAIGLAGYWFFMKTLRGNSLVLYAVGGWHAPLNVRVACARETDGKVVEKFSKPLNFDKESKNLLKNFWYYSFYRGCLFRYGYDFKGNSVPSSEISNNEYTNPYAGINFLLPANSTLLKDNELNVELDDRLFTSEIQTDQGIIFVQFYTKHDIYDSQEHINANFQNVPNTTGKVIEKTAGILPSGAGDFHITQDDGNIGIVFLAPENHLIIIYGNSQLSQYLMEIEQNFVLSPNK